MDKAESAPAAAARYGPPLDRLLTLGNPSGEWTWRNAPFADYGAMGIRLEHTGDLLRLARDWSLGDSGEPWCFGPVHACRALSVVAGGAGDISVLPDLFELMKGMERRDDDGWMEDMPAVLAGFGERAINPIAAMFRDQRTPFGVRLFLSDALERIALREPEQRGRVVKIMVDALSYARFTDPAINGQSVGVLIELNAQEALPAIRTAYAGGWVDERSQGPLELVEEDILLTKEERKSRMDAEIEAARMDPNHRLHDLVEDFDQAHLEGENESPTLDSPRHDS